MSAILFSSVIGPVPISVVLTERHSSSIGVTENPIESGAKVTDHAYVEPKKLRLEFADDAAAETYNALVRFQQTRRPFTFVSGLFIYQNMVIKSLDATRTNRNNRILEGNAELQEVIIVSSIYTAAEGDDPADATTGKGKDKPGKAGGKKSTKAARPTSEKVSGAETKDRASPTVMRGDSGTRAVEPQKSLASRMLNL